MAAKAQTNGTAATHNPNETLYCSNLPDKLQKDDLKRALYMLFTPHGPVLDITALKTPKMRGQAHVLFRSKDDSARAMRALQDFEFFGKPMKIQFAKTKSDTLAKLDGTYKQPQAAHETQPSATQQSVFAGPPGMTNTSMLQVSGPPPSSKFVDQATSPANVTTPASQGAKRSREESEEEDEGADMDMDDAAMDESEDE